jgi:hypothetical protein
MADYKGNADKHEKNGNATTWCGLPRTRQAWQTGRFSSMLIRTLLVDESEKANSVFGYSLDYQIRTQS